MDLLDLFINAFIALAAIAGAAAAYFNWRRSKSEPKPQKEEARPEKSSPRKNVNIRSGRDAVYIENSFNRGKNHDEH